ncbi:TPA: hypothetical protein DDW35_00155 [Candidatus Sumerlaeota bacterium]|nr:hypothetical protein [Candidatus Sumerlaeota bacterium]
MAHGRYFAHFAPNSLLAEFLHQSFDVIRVEARFQKALEFKTILDTVPESFHVVGGDYRDAQQ